MTIDPKKSVKLLVCARHSQRVLRPLKKHDIFANLTLTWLSIALDRGTRLAIDLDRFDDDGGAPSISVAAASPSF